MSELTPLRTPFPYEAKPDKYLTITDLMEQEGLTIEEATKKLAEMRASGETAPSALDQPGVNPARTPSPESPESPK